MDSQFRDLPYAEAGLEATIDGVGNAFGRSRRPGKALLVGRQHPPA